MLSQMSAATQQLLTDARHQVLPNALIQSRPTEAALLAALLSTDPAKRPVVDDVLRCGLLRQLHSSVTASHAPQGTIDFTNRDPGITCLPLLPPLW